MNRFIHLILLMVVCKTGAAQTADSLFHHTDTASLQDVTVKAFSSESKWKDLPAALAVINQKELHVFSSTSLVPVMNTVPGVRMEERSPGSYRLSLRGSLLRSPFGVRNVKVYWNDISLTDGGGNTYLNLVDLNQLESIEIIKGPASSLYGANTGGALILRSGEYASTNKNEFNAGIGGGSYGLLNQQLGWKYSGKNLTSNIQQVHVQSDGYRQQSAMRKDAVKWDGNVQINAKEKLSFLAFYTDLYYKTPGGLTKQQMDSAPQMARPHAGINPGAVEQKAAIYNETAFGGLTLLSIFNRYFDNTTTLTLNHTGFTNPFLTNYEKRNEWNYGGRTTFRLHTNGTRNKIQWLTGAEWEQNHSHINDYGNRLGVMDTVQFKDELYATQYFFFSQLNVELGNKFIAQLGVSNNKQVLSYRRLSDAVVKAYEKTNAGSLWAPRFSLLYKIMADVSVYGVVAKGFSPPTLAEVHPSDGNYYSGLKPEYGWNYEAGIKGSAWKNRLLFDAGYYYFKLQNAIVSQANSAGAQYFVNAGSTVEKGAEAWLKLFVVKSNMAFISSLAVWNSFSFQPYKFDNYISAGNNFSGHKLTGVPRTINVSCIEAETKTGLYVHVILNSTSSLPLDDANTSFAKAYQLLQMKMGYQKKLNKCGYNLYAGVDNMLNQHYSLGNDINAFGKRYYNPAAGINFFTGLEISF